MLKASLTAIDPKGKNLFRRLLAEAPSNRDI